MKTTHRCPKCQHDHILHIVAVADRSESYSVPMRVAHYEQAAGSILGIAMTRSSSAGELEAGVCKRCGYTELYTKNPADIIVDGVYVREYVAPPTST